MSWVLFQAGSRRTPKTWRRRLLWGVVSVPPVLLIGVLFATRAVSNWVAIVGHSRSAAPPGLGETILFSLFALLFLAVATYAVAVGTVRILRQRREEATAER